MPYTVDEILKAYKILVEGIEMDAREDEERAFGGIIRSGKGRLVEGIATHMIDIAWERLGGEQNRISFNKRIYNIPINPEYINKIKHKEVRDYITANIDDYYYGLRNDVQVWIDGEIVMAVECKSYTENAMFKRIMVDFTLLKGVVPNISCVLLQLESQLGGDYGEPTKEITYGSRSTHTIRSYFDVDLNIITLLEGERKVDRPIHNSKYYKELKKEAVESGIETLMDLLKKYK